MNKVNEMTALPALQSMSEWSDSLVADAGLRIESVPFVTVGGGLASFAITDFLRISGVPTSSIRVISPNQFPYESLRYLVYTSQICETDPLRSDSMSRIDNIWGFPSYAVERAMRRRSLQPLWNVLTEPVVTDFFNPTPFEVFRGIDREAHRIGWESMLDYGTVQLLRKRRGGGYISILCPADGSRPSAISSRYVHLGTGYSGVRYSPGVTEYRKRCGEYFRVVNAYEPHDHVYDVLMRRGGTVVIRGAGVTASRVLQRLIEDRDHSGMPVRILHFIRTYVDGPQGPRHFRRPGGDGWGYQAFSFPKAAGAGQLRRPLLKMDNAERARFIESMAATATAKRREWQYQLRRARDAGWYTALDAEVKMMEPFGQEKVRLTVARNGRHPATGDGMDPLPATLDADFVIDCTGLRLELLDNPLLADLLDHGEAATNPLGGLDVGPNFEVRRMDNNSGRMYASGVIARGGYLAPVDSFWGFSHAGQIMCDDLARRGFCRPLGMARSVVGWLRWLAGVKP